MRDLVAPPSAAPGWSPAVLTMSSRMSSRMSLRMSLRSTLAAAADGANPTTLSGPVARLVTGSSPGRAVAGVLVVQARARTRIAVVLPVPAGASASCTRAGLVASARTSATCPGLSSTPFATDSSSATSTSGSVTVRPSARPAAARIRCSASITAGEVNRVDPATVYTDVPSERVNAWGRRASAAAAASCSRACSRASPARSGCPSWVGIRTGSAVGPVVMSVAAGPTGVPVAWGSSRMLMSARARSVTSSTAVATLARAIPAVRAARSASARTWCCFQVARVCCTVAMTACAVASAHWVGSSSRLGVPAWVAGVVVSASAT